MNEQQRVDALEAQDDQPVARDCRGPELPRRRQLLKGGLGAAVAGFFTVPVSGCDASSPKGVSPAMPAIGFTPLPPQTDMTFDRVAVPEGYSARVLYAWGDPVGDGAPAWQPDASDDWRDQMQQAGDNHDGMHFFPFPEAPNQRGLLVMNHEKVSLNFLHPAGPTFRDGADGRRFRPEGEVKKEQAAHGVSVIEIRRQPDDVWDRVMDSPYNRRITGMTPMSLRGPAAGTAALKTASDPDGRTVLGTLANCALGFTPWGTYLACEENWPNYFVNRDREDYVTRVAHHRYRLSQEQNSKYFAWESVDPRFDATPYADQPHGGHVNEPNRFGWVVEIDPFDPDSTPVKRTAMGRLVRECATPSVAPDGSMAFYFGDDTRGEYIYKFVPAGRYQPDDREANRHLLDDGTLYVGVFGDRGKGQWKPLVFGEEPLTPDNDFHSQAQVMIEARRAADLLGATTMDRPEWVAVKPDNREVYVTLTNNDKRGREEGQPINSANPRWENEHGHILRWREKGDDPAATTFQWEIFLLAGYPQGSDVPANQIGTIQGDIFSSPDGLWFDPAGRLWIETDYDEDSPNHQGMGTNQLLCANPYSGEVKRFLVGPKGCEITGITGTPDGTTLWINVQHPTLSFPASDGKTRPRSATVVITKDDGGEIGS